MLRLLSLALLFLTACDGTDDDFPYPPADRSLPTITLDELLGHPLELGSYTTEGAVDTVFACPPCPPDMDCAPCPPEGVRFIHPAREIGQQSVFVSMPDATPFAEGETYRISVQVNAPMLTDATPAVLIGATRL